MATSMHIEFSTIQFSKHKILAKVICSVIHSLPNNKAIFKLRRRLKNDLAHIVATKTNKIPERKLIYF